MNLIYPKRIYPRKDHTIIDNLLISQHDYHDKLEKPLDTNKSFKNDESIVRKNSILSEKYNSVLPKIDVSSVNYSTIRCEPTGRTINNIADNLNKLFPHSDIKNHIVSGIANRSISQEEKNYDFLQKKLNKKENNKDIIDFCDEYSQALDSSFDEYNSIFENSQLQSKNTITTGIKRKSKTNLSK